MMKKRFLLLCCLLVMVLSLPLLAQAEALGQTATFETPIAAEWMTIDRVEATQTQDYLLLNVTFTLKEDLSDEELAALMFMYFNVMPNAESTAFPDGFVSGYVEPEDISLGVSFVPGATYTEKSQWKGIDALPDVLYLRPYYQSVETWGDAIELKLSDARVQDITDAGDLPSSLAEGGDGNG